MASAKATKRAEQVREWWTITKRNPLYQMLINDGWRDMTALNAWVNMHALAACREEHSLLESDANWTEIETQMYKYPPLWLVKNWHEPTVKKTSKFFNRRYYVIDEKPGRFTVKQSSVITGLISVSDIDDLYDWLGLIGGSQGEFAEQIRLAEEARKRNEVIPSE